MPTLNGSPFPRRLFNILGPFFGLLLVIGLFCLSSTVRPYFFTGANFKIILTQTVIVAIGTLGMTIIIVSGGIDLSVGSLVALTSVVGATALLKGHSAFTAAWERPDAFRRVFSSIGTYVGLRGGNDYPTLIRKTEPKPIRVFLQDGSNDLNIYGGNWVLANPEILSALLVSGYIAKHVHA